MVPSEYRRIAPRVSGRTRFYKLRVYAEEGSRGARRGVGPGISTRTHKAEPDATLGIMESEVPPNGLALRIGPGYQ
jgi:hypothetical protein